MGLIPNLLMPPPRLDLSHLLFEDVAYDLAHRLDEDLLGLSQRRNDVLGLILGHASRGRTLKFVGRFASSRSHLETVLELYDVNSHSSLVHQTGTHPHVNAQPFLGMVLFCLGFPDQALAQSNAAIAEARRLTHPTSLATGLGLGLLVLSLAGADEALAQRLDELVALA